MGPGVLMTYCHKHLWVPLLGQAIVPASRRGYELYLREITTIPGTVSLSSSQLVRHPVATAYYSSMGRLNVRGELFRPLNVGRQIRLMLLTFRAVVR